MNVLEVTNVSKAFGGIVALNGCSLNVAQGQITGLIGSSTSSRAMRRSIRAPFRMLAKRLPTPRQTPSLVWEWGVHFS